MLNGFNDPWILAPAIDLGYSQKSKAFYLPWLPKGENNGVYICFGIVLDETWLHLASDNQINRKVVWSSFVIALSVCILDLKSYNTDCCNWEDPQAAERIVGRTSRRWKQWKARGGQTGSYKIYSFIFGNHFILVRVTVNPKPVPGSQGVRQESTLGGTLLHCTHTFTPRASLVCFWKWEETR